MTLEQILNEGDVVIKETVGGVEIRRANGSECFTPNQSMYKEYGLTYSEGDKAFKDLAQKEIDREKAITDKLQLNMFKKYLTHVQKN